MENVEFKDIEPEVFNFEKDGDSVEGVLIRKNSGVGVYNSNLYVVEAPNKNLITFFGSTVLDNRMALVDVGDVIRVEYKGLEETKTGQKVKIFKVQKGEVKETKESPL